MVVISNKTDHHDLPQPNSTELAVEELQWCAPSRRVSRGVRVQTASIGTVNASRYQQTGTEPAEMYWHQ